MANAYVNYKAIITTSELTTLYTVGSETTAIIKSLRITNVDEENDCKIRAFVVDTDSVSYTLEANRNCGCDREDTSLSSRNTNKPRLIRRLNKYNKTRYTDQGPTGRCPYSKRRGR